MSTLLHIPSERPAAKRTVRRPASLGITALVCGILSVLGVVVHSLWGPFSPSPSFTEQVINDVAGVKDAVLSSFTGEQRAKPVPVDTGNIDRIVTQTIVLLSVIGILMAILAYVRRENSRLVGSALIISGTAFVIQYLLFPLLVIGAIGVAVLIAAAF